MKKLFASIIAVAIVLSMVACGGASSAAPASSAADAAPAAPTEWKPEKPITIINPYKAGGNGDLEIKAMQPALEAVLGQAIVSEYVTTGGGVAATEKVYKAAPDGYTLLYLSNPAASVSQLTDKVDYDVREFEYLRSVSGEWRCVGARPELGINTVEELKALAKEKKLTIAHSGIGSSGHIQTLLVENALGIDLNDVPFEGSAAAKTAFLGGHVDLWAIDGSTIAPLIESGDAVAIATCGAERHKAIVNERDLAIAIEQNHITGAGLDAMSSEPPAEDCPLLKLERVILTPHVGGNTADNEKKMVERCVDNILRIEQKKPLRRRELVNQSGLRTQFETEE